jgi:hypothetical protein
LQLKDFFFLIGKKKFQCQTDPINEDNFQYDGGYKPANNQGGYKRRKEEEK